MTDKGFSRRGVLRLAGPAVAAPIALSVVEAAPAAASVTLGRNQSFDQDWRFLKGDGATFAEPDFDDNAWRRVDLPHDWSIEDLEAGGPAVNGEIRDYDTAPLWQAVKGGPQKIGPFNRSLSGGGRDTGFTVGGVGWYRKRFRMTTMAPDTRVELVFDGVYMDAEVWLNGKRIGGRPYGYVPFAFDLTPYANKNGDNVVAVRVANLGDNSRWYAGSGIYRHVWLNVTGAQHFKLWGVSVTTPEVTADAATLAIVVETDGGAENLEVVVRVIDARDRVVAEGRESIGALGQIRLKLGQPLLWSPKTPNLYKLECELLSGDRRVDRMTTRFGVRTIAIDAEHGLRINGEQYKMRGGCVHHDNGHLGAAAIDRAEERKLELLKARGFNAIRTSHYPPSPAFLDSCDRLGLMVIEEAFDCWKIGKNPDDYQLYFDGWWRDDLSAMVRRDRNHPSVVLWSIGNEIPEVGKPEAVETARLLAAEIRRLDPTRQVTEAINSATGPAVTQYLDVVGYNYSVSAYERDHARYPGRVMMGSESFAKEVDRIWRLTEQHNYLIGDFVWSAVDYLGEPGVGQSALSPAQFVYGQADYPWFGAYTGDLDLIGQQKPQSLLRDVVWGISAIEMVVQRPLPEGRKENISQWGARDALRSWTWPQAMRQELSVQVFTRADHVDLELNGRRIGERRLSPDDQSVAEFSVPYAPGRLVATAYRQGAQVGRCMLETAGASAALRVRADRSSIRASRNDLAFVTIEIVDAQGRLVPDAVSVVEIALSGPARLAGFGNANPRGVASFQQPVAKTWHGRALAILQPTGNTGVVVLEARAQGLRGAKQQIRLR